MADTALITGASSGIGAELARLHASRGGDAVLVARRADKLAELKAEIEAAHGTRILAVALDLGAADAVARLAAEIAEAGMQVDILINNAGFGGHGMHVDRALDAEAAMIDLNVKALVALTHHFGGEMAARGRGRILNVGSVAGFVPGPTQAVYFATKAFVNSFSQAIDHELRPRGVTCTVLTPGYVVTEFAKVANLEGTPMTQAAGASASSVAKIGYDAMLRGKLVAFNEAKLAFLMQWALPFMPRRAQLKMMEKMQTKAA